MNNIVISTIFAYLELFWNFFGTCIFWLNFFGTLARNFFGTHEISRNFFWTFLELGVLADLFLNFFWTLTRNFFGTPRIGRNFFGTANFERNFFGTFWLHFAFWWFFPSVLNSWLQTKRMQLQRLCEKLLAASAKASCLPCPQAQGLLRSSGLLRSREWVRASTNKCECRFWTKLMGSHTPQAGRLPQLAPPSWAWTQLRRRSQLQSWLSTLA